jgi:hypothetical protein
MQLTHSLKAPGFNPRAYKVKNRFQSFAFKFNLYRYTAAVVLSGRLMVVHGGCPAQGSSWLSDTAVLDLSTLTWRHVDVQVAGTENVRHKRIAVGRYKLIFSLPIA